jgi:NADH dehydrogenase (ubiquinone) Fe-S protein 2
MELYERVSSARLHAAYVRPGGVVFDIPHGLLNDIFHWATQFSSRVDKIEQIVTGNRIWKQRTVSIGNVTAQEVLDYSFSGVMLCGSDEHWRIAPVHLISAALVSHIAILCASRPNNKLWVYVHALLRPIFSTP